MWLNGGHEEQLKNKGALRRSCAIYKLSFKHSHLNIRFSDPVSRALKVNDQNRIMMSLKNNEEVNNNFHQRIKNSDLKKAVSSFFRNSSSKANQGEKSGWRSLDTGLEALQKPVTW